MKIKFHLDKKNNPHTESGMKVLYGHAKRGGYKLRWYLILSLVISPALVAGYYLFYKQIMVIAPAVITNDPLTITATREAIVEPFSANVGMELKIRDEIMRLTDNTLAADIQFIESEISKLQLEKMDISNLYKHAISKSEENQRKIQKIQANYDKHREKGQVPELDYANIVNTSNALTDQVNQLKLGFFQASRALKENELAGPLSKEKRALEKELIIKKVEQQNLVIHSPYKGRVIDIHVIEGQRVTPNTPLVTLSKDTQPHVIAYLNPKHIKYSALGSKALVEFPDGRKVSAKVSTPAQSVDTLPDELLTPFEGRPAYIKVKLSFDKNIDNSHWVEGMGVKVHFDMDLFG